MTDTDSGRVVVVTGASGGIGQATAVALARRGDRVALLARGEKGLAGAAEDVRAAGGTPLVVPVDVSDAEAVEAAADRVERELGPVDVWCDVAFSTVFAPFDQVTTEEYRRVTGVTYLGFVHGTMAALRRVKPRDRGVVVQTGSALGRRGIPLQSVYCGAKHAIKGFTESVLTELRHEGSNVRITQVYAPGVDTPQFLDWYLARNGYSGQLTEADDPPDAPVDLFSPADGPDGRDFGARGRFSDRSWSRDPQSWVSRYHGAVAALAAAGLPGVAAALHRGR
ncbi:short-chain dehydrogenase [Geodermatophilus sp. TF02-6]|uniref:SDR family oxidoreductase n=1 Tax=Geodermatophilus sp. TF02-6 TaxID=2250575 RepID=UPI000DEA7675|nr:SDR family oxidoreductase [Geodermatophilus sp. TF02-6]RBY78945.1 short-chain dehydrogenase [Geodermatophilus sp. TF02-6]